MMHQIEVSVPEKSKAFHYDRVHEQTQYQSPTSLGSQVLGKGVLFQKSMLEFHFDLI